MRAISMIAAALLAAATAAAESNRCPQLEAAHADAVEAFFRRERLAEALARAHAAADIGQCSPRELGQLIAAIQKAEAVVPGPRTEEPQSAYRDRVVEACDALAMTAEQRRRAMLVYLPQIPLAADERREQQASKRSAAEIREDAEKTRKLANAVGSTSARLHKLGNVFEQRQEQAVGGGHSSDIAQGGGSAKTSDAPIVLAQSSRGLDRHYLPSASGSPGSSPGMVERTLAWTNGTGVDLLRRSNDLPEEGWAGARKFGYEMGGKTVLAAGYIVGQIPSVGRGLVQFGSNLVFDPVKAGTDAGVLVYEMGKGVVLGSWGVVRGAYEDTKSFATDRRTTYQFLKASTGIVGTVAIVGGATAVITRVGAAAGAAGTAAVAEEAALAGGRSAVGEAVLVGERQAVTLAGTEASGGSSAVNIASRGARAPSTVLGRAINSLKGQLSAEGDFVAEAGPWERASVHGEIAQSPVYRGGTSLEEVFVNNQTGERLVRHVVYNRDGAIVHQTFRPVAKFGAQ